MCRTIPELSGIQLSDRGELQGISGKSGFSAVPVPAPVVALAVLSHRSLSFTLLLYAFQSKKEDLCQ